MNGFRSSNNGLATSDPCPVFSFPEDSDDSFQEIAWYALRTRSNHERTAAAILDSKGYEQFLPVYWRDRCRSDRMVETEKPLFPGYLFCRFDARCALPILVTPGVACIVCFGKKPLPLSDAEIQSVRSVLNAGLALGPYPFLREGQRVRVTVGPLRGTEGFLVKHRDECRMVISINMLQRSVLVEIDPQCVNPI
jgi:transcription antitermination factor NusG